MTTFYLDTHLTPTSGAISMDDMRTAFGVTGSISMGDYYRNGGSWATGSYNGMYEWSTGEIAWHPTEYSFQGYDYMREHVSNGVWRALWGGSEYRSASGSAANSGIRIASSGGTGGGWGDAPYKWFSKGATDKTSSNPWAASGYKYYDLHSEYHNGASNKWGGAVPTSGAISMTHFYGTAKYYSGEQG